MARGGARNRSGPRPDPSSGRSDARGFSLRNLPAEGYAGDVPDFPLPNASVRELEVWEQAWRTPQACAWSLPSERWRAATVAMWVRVKVRCEDPEAPSSLFGQLHRFADQIGMTTAGLAEMGWQVAVDELVEKAATRTAAPSGDPGTDPVGESPGPAASHQTSHPSRPALDPWGEADRPAPPSRARRLRAVGDQ